MAEADLTRPAFRYSSAGRRPERLNQSRNVNAPVQLARGWAAGLLGLPGDIEGLVRLLPGLDETPRLPTSDFYREYLPGYDERPAARAMSGLGALAGGAGATGVVRGGLGAVKRATDLNAIRDYVRATQGVSGLPGTAVVKPRGGNWLKGPGAPDDALQVLKVRDRFGMTDPTELSAALGIPLEEAQALHASNAPNAAINQWIDQKLARYMRNEMGTPEDPLRELAERDILHYAPGEPSDTQKTRAALVRSREGYPAGGLGESDLARRWEVISDYPITPERAGDLMRLGEGSPTIRGNPWLAKVPPETSVYSIDASAGYGDVPLGFNHLIDELRNAVREGSDLPRELQLRPEQLSKVSMPQAVELVDRINKWRAAQKVEADLARSTNVATQTFKEYPEQGYKWVEIKTPEEVQALPEGYSLSTITNEKLPPGHMGRNSYAVVDPQGLMLEGAGMGYTEADAVDKFKRAYYGKSIEDALQYEADVMGHCVGRYCPDIMEGRSRIFSLRDAKGQPHVTVEVRPGKQLSERDLPDDVRDMLAEQYGDESREVFEAAVQRYLKERAVPDEIVQIKGKGNRAPKDDYLPYVQDFVTSQPWGRVGDLKNARLVDVGEDAAQSIGKRFLTEQEWLEYDRASRAPAGGRGKDFARGGMVSAAGGGPAQYDPARISALVEELLMEA